MGYCIYQRESSFVIRKEHFPAFIAAAQKAYPHKFDSMSSVRDIFQYFAFSVEGDADGNLAGVKFTGEKSGSEDRLFDLAAPYVEAGSYITFVGEEDEMFQYCFNGQACEEVYPLLVWPESHLPPKDGMTRYQLPFSIADEIVIDAASEQDARYRAETVSVEAILSRV